MEYKAAVITISDKGAVGEREDTSGPACVQILKNKKWKVVYKNIIPDDFKQIADELKKVSDNLKVDLIITTGGTGLSVRDVTPEATMSVCQRAVPGIPEAMRAESLRKTPMGMLSRAVAGIREKTLIVNLPGSEKAARECLDVVIKPIYHGVEVLVGSATECGRF